MYYIINRMAKRRKKAHRRHGMQVLTLCISTTMVLVLLGLVVFSVLLARNLSEYVKENLTVTVMLRDNVSDKDVRKLCTTLRKRPYSRNIDYISKEQAQKEQTEAMGSDPSEFLGFNPFTATLEVRLKADYVNRDSLGRIGKELKKNPMVSDVAYQEDLMNKVNGNIQKINIILLVLAVLLSCVSFSLINNTVRLSIYSRRFSIHTMKLVGASWGFIRRPFVQNMMVVGLIAAVLACGALGCGMYWLAEYEPGVLNVITWIDLTVVGASVVCFGLIITALCSYFSVNRYLKMTAGELYKI